jgi:hypothetical protein
VVVGVAVVEVDDLVFDDEVELLVDDALEDEEDDVSATSEEDEDDVGGPFSTPPTTPFPPLPVVSELLRKISVGKTLISR